MPKHSHKRKSNKSPDVQGVNMGRKLDLGLDLKLANPPSMSTSQPSRVLNKLTTQNLVNVEKTYIIKLKSDNIVQSTVKQIGKYNPKSPQFNTIKSQVKTSLNEFLVRHNIQLDRVQKYKYTINGFSGQFTLEELKAFDLDDQVQSINEQ
jgi:hypothetical protein